LPAVTGVYYIYNESGNLYWEKYKHQKRLNQHFTGITNSAKRFKLKYLPYLTKKQEVNWWLFKESEEIKKKQPKYNRAQRKSIFQWALYPEMDEKVI
jgi:DNA polymerase-3 subunit epsilon